MTFYLQDMYTEGDFVFDRQKLQEEQAEAEYDKNVDIISYL